MHIHDKAATMIIYLLFLSYSRFLWTNNIPTSKNANVYYRIVWSNFCIFEHFYLSLWLHSTHSQKNNLYFHLQCCLFGEITFLTKIFTVHGEKRVLRDVGYSPHPPSRDEISPTLKKAFFCVTNRAATKKHTQEHLCIIIKVAPISQKYRKCAFITSRKAFFYECLFQTYFQNLFE